MQGEHYFVLVPCLVQRLGELAAVVPCGVPVPADYGTASTTILPSYSPSAVLNAYVPGELNTC